MGRLNVDLKTYGAIYDFDVDGGAIGTINLGAALPPGFCTYMALAYIINQPVGAVGTNISFGITGIGTSALFVSANAAAWASSGVYHTVDPTDAYNFQNPVGANGGNITFSIFAAPLIAGKIVISVIGAQFGAGI